jgi:hypothetical protein
MIRTNTTPVCPVNLTHVDCEILLSSSRCFYVFFVNWKKTFFTFFQYHIYICSLGWYSGRVSERA